MSILPDLNPIIKKRYLEIQEPSLSDTLGDWQRLLREFKDKLGYKEVRVELFLLNDLSKILRDSNWKVTATFSEIDGCVQLVNLEKNNQEARSYALSCDIGTTTLVMNLVDLNTGKAIDSKTNYNPQRAYGEDVTSRMMYCDEKDGLNTLHRLVVDELNSMIGYLCKSQGINQD